MRPIALLILSLLLLGCGGNAAPTQVISLPSTPYASPTRAAPATALPATALPTPAEAVASSPPAAPEAIPIPAATLTNAAGETQAGVAGSYCLNGQCVTDDLSALAVPAEPLAVAPQEQLTFAFGHGASQLTTMRVLAWTPYTEMSPPPGTALVALDAPELAMGDLPPGATATWQAPPMAGEYVLDVNSVYDNSETIAYTWHIVVR